MAAERRSKGSSKALFPIDPASEVARAVSAIKAALQNAPTLVTPRVEARKLLVTDASLVGVGAALFQFSEIDNSWNPCAFMSKTLSPAARNYMIVELEAFAIVLALAEWEVWLRAAPFELVSDHRAVSCLVSGAHAPPSRRLLRWAEAVGSFSFTLHWAPGKSEWLVIADYLSRHAHENDPKDALVSYVRAMATFGNADAKQQFFPSSRDADEGDGSTDDPAYRIRVGEVALSANVVSRFPYLATEERGAAAKKHMTKRAWCPRAWAECQEAWRKAEAAETRPRGDTVTIAQVEMLSTTSPYLSDVADALTNNECVYERSVQMLLARDTIVSKPFGEGKYLLWHVSDRSELPRVFVPLLAERDTDIDAGREG